MLAKGSTILKRVCGLRDHRQTGSFICVSNRREDNGISNFYTSRLHDDRRWDRVAIVCALLPVETVLRYGMSDTCA